MVQMAQIKNYLSYPKFAAAKLKIIFLDKNYFLQEASIKALRELGHEVLALKIPRDPSQMLQLLLKSCIEIKPDCIIGNNHLGFDEEGKIAHILKELQIPVIFWYLDDFRFIIFNGKHHANPFTAIFTFEEKQVFPLKKLGFENAFYLPTAASFDPDGQYEDPQFAFLKNAVTFVGNSFETTKIRRQKSHYNSLLSSRLSPAEMENLQHDLVHQIEKRFANHFPDKDSLYHFAAYAAAEASQIYRKHTLSHLHDKYFQIFGDDKWKELLHNAKIQPASHYETNTPKVYHHSFINLNLSSQQLENTVSMRPFDVPAAGGFLLTDWKESLADLFDVQKEIAAFHSIEEMNDKIAYFRKNPTEREKIRQKACERVKKEHLVRHRVEQLLQTAGKIWR
jgi:spore maturation protein CgeB